MSYENIMRLFNDAVTGGLIRPKFRVINKTADYTVTPTDFGSIFTTRSGTGVIFTLPAASSLNSGNWALFINVANYNMVVKGANEGLVVFNDLTADAIAFSTTNEKIAGMFLAISDGTSWIVLPIATETQTIKVSTAASTSPSSSESATPTSSPSRTPSSSPSRTPSRTPSSSPSRTPSSSPSST